MKSLLSITALLEIVTGIVLVSVPSVVVSLLLGTSLTDPGLILFARIGGMVLTALAIACWLSRNDTKAGGVMVKVMLSYNVSAIILLGYAAVVEHLAGIGLWPAVLLHAALLIWCVVKLPRG